ncbi:DUF6602 domain-containing protein [Vibrio alginolyticus]
MIQKISELLLKIAKKEEQAIQNIGIRHAPTIGHMYEGLTKKILDLSLPQGIDVRVVSGFIIDGSRNMSRQIDCMVVSGEGEKLPSIDEYLYHVKDVIAVIEVKKTLYSTELLSALNLHNSVLSLFDSYSNSDEFRSFNPYYAAREFTSLFGERAPQYNSVEFNQLSTNQQAIYHALVLEQLVPLRIVLGYDGFSSEVALRKAFVDILHDNLSQTGFAVRNLPQLMISSDFSLVKTNGMPYMSEVSPDGWWGIVTSSNANPIYILLEMLLTKIEIFSKVQFDWGEDLREENLVHFLSAKACTADSESINWELCLKNFNSELFDDRMPYSNWKPLEIDEVVYRLIELLADESSDILKFDSPKLSALIDSFSITFEQLKVLAIDTRLIATVENGFMFNATVGYGIHNGKFIAANNSNGRLDRWLDNELDK